METEIRVGKELLAESRMLYPLVRISILKMIDGKVLGCWLTPLAMLVIEPGEQYSVSLTEEEMNLETVLDLAPCLRTVVERARGIHRIKVS